MISTDSMDRSWNLKRVSRGVLRRVVGIGHSARWRLGGGRRSIRELGNLHERHRGERVWIICNGPSLAKTDMSMLSEEVTISMNRAYLSWPDWGFTPSYYLAINDLVLQQWHSDIAALDTVKFVNWRARRWFENGENTPIFLKLAYSFRDKFSRDIRRGIHSGGTVTFAALQLAYFLGAAEAVIVGMDHRFAAVGVPNSKERRNEESDGDHFRPDYFPKGSLWELPDLLRSEAAYRRAREAFEGAGRTITDATTDGACDVFPKVTLAELFA